jgi:hypothetical protein
VMGTFVSTYLGRQFEAFNDNNYVPVPGTLRFGNRTVRRIARIASQTTVPYVTPYRDRPDLVQVSGTTGSVYEIKSGDIFSLLNPAWFLREVAPAIKDLNYYVPLLNGISPNVSYAAGATYASGIVMYPSFPFNPPGFELVTFDEYMAAPGAILWDLIPTPLASLLVAAAASVGNGSSLPAATEEVLESEFAARQAVSAGEAAVNTSSEAESLAVDEVDAEAALEIAEV